MGFCWIETGTLRSRNGDDVALRWVALLTLLGCLQLAGCQSQPVASAPTSRSGPLRSFVFGTPEGKTISSLSLRGRETVILFLATYDPICQVVARRLDALARSRVPRINVVAVVLEPPQNSVFAQVYRDTLELGYPVVLADPATLKAQGAFGNVWSIPTFVLLDPEMREVFRVQGSEGLGQLERELQRTAVPPR